MLKKLSYSILITLILSLQSNIFANDLITAVKYGAVDVVEELINNNSYVDVNAKDEFGKTALHYACANPIQNKEKYKQLIKMLIKKGANINAQDKRGFTPLHEIIFAKNTNLFIFLIKNTESNLYKKSKSERILFTFLFKLGGFMLERSIFKTCLPLIVSRSHEYFLDRKTREITIPAEIQIHKSSFRKIKKICEVLRMLSFRFGLDLASHIISYTNGQDYPVYTPETYTYTPIIHTIENNQDNIYTPPQIDHQVILAVEPTDRDIITPVTAPAQIPTQNNNNKRKRDNQNQLDTEYPRKRRKVQPQTHIQTPRNNKRKRDHNNQLDTEYPNKKAKLQ